MYVLPGVRLVTGDWWGAETGPKRQLCLLSIHTDQRWQLYDPPLNIKCTCFGISGVLSSSESGHWDHWMVESVCMCGLCVGCHGSSRDSGLFSMCLPAWLLSVHFVPELISSDWLCFHWFSCVLIIISCVLITSSSSSCLSSLESSSD